MTYKKVRMTHQKVRMTRYHLQHQEYERVLDLCHGCRVLFR